MSMFKLLIVGLAVALLLALLSPLASSEPDGLEKFAGDHGFAARGDRPLFSILQGYLFPGIDNAPASVVLAGAVGVILITALVLIIGRALRSKREE